MSERLFEFPESVTVKPLLETPERIIQPGSWQLQLQLGSYAMAIAKGDVAGLIGSDIFPDEAYEESV